MELLEPEQRIGDEEVAHLSAAEVEDQGAPVRVLAAARVRVLVQGSAVELCQRPRILGEVRGDPVDDHSDAGLMEPVDQVAQVVGGAEARGGREVRRDLVAPGGTVRVLGHRQELHVREPRVDDVVGELVRERAVVQPSAP